MKTVFKWVYCPNYCTLCRECVDTCGKALKVSNLKRIVRDPNKCTECETCSSICDSIYTEFITTEE